MPSGPGTHPLALQAESSPSDLRKGHDEIAGAHIGLTVLQWSHPGIAVAIVSHIDIQRRCPTADERPLEWDPRPGSRGGNGAMQDGRMRGVNATFQGLQPVPLLHHFRTMAMA